MFTQPDNIVLKKAAIIERYLRRMLEEYLANQNLDNFIHIDAIDSQYRKILSNRY